MSDIFTKQIGPEISCEEILSPVFQGKIRMEIVIQHCSKQHSNIDIQCIYI